jgi:N-hydroxyarylamine O-acetyltransferase
MTVPFESLDIHLDRPISLVLDALVAKIVDGHRGGFCYENNSLFAAALGALGVPHELLSAGVIRADGTFGPPFDHLVVRSEFGGVEYLLDVGFGEGFRAPLPIDGEWHDEAPSAEYRARHDGDEVLVEHRKHDQIRPDYRIDLHPREQAEFSAMCRYHQTSPDSGFTRRWTVSLATDTGRVTAVPGRLVETHHGERTETPVAGAAQLAEVLETRFGIGNVDVERLTTQVPKHPA